VSRLVDLGHMPYGDAYRIQEELLEQIKAGNRKDTLLFVEHDPVLTLGANFHADNLLLTADEYQARRIQVVSTNRGGDVTYHGPNQLVIYPIFDISRHGKDLHKWLRSLEEAIILVLADFGLYGYRMPPHTGVWLNSKKVAAIGIKVSRWVSMHGIALNCDNDLAPFQSIVPCGVKDFEVTSLSQEANKRITIEEAKPLVAKAFENVFNMTLQIANRSEFMDEINGASKTQALP
jgi:lipoyl(octanoyl) transferase